MIYPLQNAIARNQLLAVACHMGIDRAIRTRCTTGRTETMASTHFCTISTGRSASSASMSVTRPTNPAADGAGSQPTKHEQNWRPTNE